ncbi:hypothetical protein F4780DRAFT_2716 [Xylariomycetidae sp. FL0641]|nr:hypothetical protein F4780DRAFT_2716 [Xylariomycetidae sp. FL0641]
MSEPEPRRSVRATKGQHTKAFDLENGPEPPKRRQSKKNIKKAAEKEEKHEEEDEEIIRCICGATTQDDDDANEPWIACDKCGAWQHNVCVGMSVFTEDLTKDYFCEQCAPDDHRQTLEAMEKGERPWEDRRRKYEDEKKRKKGSKKGKGKRASDPKERSSPAASAKTKPSPTPDIKKDEPTPDSAAKGKRKSREYSQGPLNKLRKISEPQAMPAVPNYTPPADLPESIQKLEGARRQAALGLQKSLDVAIDQAEKKNLYSLPQGSTKKAVSERLAIELERAFQDTHPHTSQNASQLRALVFSLKSNVELAARVLNRTLTPPSFVVMTGDELATKELQRENAEMKARADKQSILITEDGPRVRRTHKGEEIVEGDNVAVTGDDAPSHLRQQGAREAAQTDGTGNERAKSISQERGTPAHARRASTGPLRVDTQPQQSPRPSDFDIGKVFSSVRSPSVSHQRRASTQVHSAGPVDDPDVDRLLEDDENDSPPYSPVEDTDPDVVWRGPLVMTNVANIPMIAKYMGGADLSKLRGIPWKDLIPTFLTVAGRIPEEKAVPYLCGLRYTAMIDLVITSITPAHPHDEAARKQFLAVIDYFRSKKRYGVVGERKLGNVRDTYLIPVSEGKEPIPEPMQNIGDHLIPQERSEPMLLLVFVVRDDKQTPTQADQASGSQQLPAATATQQGHALPRNPSISTPAMSPATPQGSGQAMVPQTRGPGNAPSVPQPNPAPDPQQSRPRDQNIPLTPDVLKAAQEEGIRQAKEALGDYFNSPTITFLLPHAHRMKEGEWNAVRRCFERDSQSTKDLVLLSRLLTEEGNRAGKNGQPVQTPAESTVVAQTTLAAAAVSNPEPTPGPPPSQPTV